MLLTISTTRAPATDLGWLLHKNPSRIQRFSLSYGEATVAYPEATDTHCTAALLVAVDPVGLVRGRGPSGDGGALEQYVNDRPYVASSFVSVAIGEVFGSALNGRCRDRPDLVDEALPLTLTLSAVPARGGEALLRRLFEPLGYTVDLQPVALDPTYPQWGDSRYFGVTLTGTLRLRDALAHLYVLIPVLDNEKHYWIGEAEVEKLLRHGGDWLAAHPERDLIARRYLKFRRSLADAALAQLAETAQEADELDAETETDAAPSEAKVPREQKLEAKISLNQQRIDTVIGLIDASDATSIVDLGCGEGKLLRELLKLRHLQRIVGMDVSVRSLEAAHDRLKLDRLPERQRQRITLMHGALTYRDSRLAGFDAATVIEVIEHLDPPRLAAFERVLFEASAPRLIVVTTPNVEYNVRFETLPAGQFRHPDHRFEWTRAEFEHWSRTLAERYGYAVTFAGIGDVDPELGAPTQLARFERTTSEAAA